MFNCNKSSDLEHVEIARLLPHLNAFYDNNLKLQTLLTNFYGVMFFKMTNYPQLGNTCMAKKHFSAFNT